MQLQEVKHREQENPDKINEVPEQAGNFDAVRVALRIGLPKPGAGSPEVRDDKPASQHVQAVQRGEGEIDREIGAVRRHEGREALDVGWLELKLVCGFISLLHGCVMVLGRKSIMSRVRMQFKAQDFSIFAVQSLGAPKPRATFQMTRLPHHICYTAFDSYCSV